MGNESAISALPPRANQTPDKFRDSIDACIAKVLAPAPSAGARLSLATAELFDCVRLLHAQLFTGMVNDGERRPHSEVKALAKGLLAIIRTTVRELPDGSFYSDERSKIAELFTSAEELICLCDLIASSPPSRVSFESGKRCDLAHNQILKFETIAKLAGDAFASLPTSDPHGIRQVKLISADGTASVVTHTFGEANEPALLAHLAELPARPPVVDQVRADIKLMLTKLRGPLRLLAAELLKSEQEFPEVSSRDLPFVIGLTPGTRISDHQLDGLIKRENKAFAAAGKAVWFHRLENGVQVLPASERPKAKHGKKSARRQSAANRP